MKIISLIICLLLATTIFGAEIGAQLSLISPPAILKEGDLVEGLIKIWPLENADLTEFKKIEDKVIGNSFYISQVENIEFSANNSDVVEVKVLAIIKRAKENSPSQINYKDLNIQLQVPEIHLATTDKESADYYVMNQSVNYSNITGIAIATTALILLTFIGFKYNNIKQFILRLRADPIALANKKYDELFSRANKREDFEEIYAVKEEWLKLIKIPMPSPSIDNFFSIINKYQYKKFWTNEDLREVQNSFDLIRRSFK